MSSLRLIKLKLLDLLSTVNPLLSLRSYGLMMLSKSLVVVVVVAAAAAACYYYFITRDSIAGSEYMLRQFRLSVCPSVRPSHGWIGQKQLKLGLELSN